MRSCCLALAAFLGVASACAQASNPGTLTATPNPGTVQSTYVLTATFGNTAANTAAGSAAGVPTGTVTFADAGTTLGTTKLTLLSPGFVPGAISSSVHLGKLAANSKPIVRDLNGDGIPDVLLVESDGVYVSFGNADGTFTTTANGTVNAPAISVSSCPVVIDAAVGTFLVPNGQSSGAEQDVALLCASSASATSDDLYIFENVNGSGTFQQYSHLANVPLATHIAVGAFRDASAQNDLFLTVRENGTWYGLVLYGQSTGYFYMETGWMSLVAMPEAQYATQLAALDLNNDFHDDLVLLSTHAGTSNLLNVYQAGSSGGVLPSAPTYSINVGDGSADSSFALVKAGLPYIYAAEPGSAIAYRGVGTDTYVHVLSYAGGSSIGFNAPVTVGVSGITSLASDDFNGTDTPI